MRRTVILLATTVAMLLMTGGVTLAQTAPRGALDATCEDFQGIGGGWFGFGGDNTVSQTFTAVNSGKLISVQAMRVGKQSGDGDVTMQLVALTDSGAPANNVLASTTVTGSAIPAEGSTTLTGNFDPASAASVVAGRRYALVLRATGTLSGWWGWMPSNLCNGEAYDGEFPRTDQDLPFASYVLNDDFSGARPIRGDAVTIAGSTETATRENGEPDHYTSGSDAIWVGDHSVWFRWRAPASGSTTVDTCEGTIDSILAVYTGTQLDALTRIADNNNACASGWGSKVTFNATAGTTYQIAVGDAGGARENAFTLKLSAPSLTAPANDNFSAAREITGSAVSVFGSNFEATRESNEPFFFQDPVSHGFIGGKSVWYRWTAPTTGSVRVDTCAGDYDSLLGVYTGDAVDALTEITANNDGCPRGAGSRLAFNATAGTTYWILVDGTGAYGARDDDQGTFTLRVSDITRPAVTGVVPANRATSVPATANVSATFSEAMDASTLRKSDTLRSTTFTLSRNNADGTTTRIAAEVRYNATTRKAILNPTTDLRLGNTYVATVRGGSSGVEDLAGNALARDRVWRFTVG